MAEVAKFNPVRGLEQRFVVSVDSGSECSVLSEQIALRVETIIRNTVLLTDNFRKNEVAYNDEPEYDRVVPTTLLDQNGITPVDPNSMYRIRLVRLKTPVNGRLEGFDILTRPRVFEREQRPRGLFRRQTTKQTSLWTPAQPDYAYIGAVTRRGLVKPLLGVKLGGPEKRLELDCDVITDLTKPDELSPDGIIATRQDVIRANPSHRQLLVSIYNTLDDHPRYKDVDSLLKPPTGKLIWNNGAPASEELKQFGLEAIRGYLGPDDPTAEFCITALLDLVRRGQTMRIDCSIPKDDITYPGITEVRSIEQQPNVYDVSTTVSITNSTKVRGLSLFPMLRLVPSSRVPLVFNSIDPTSEQHRQTVEEYATLLKHKKKYGHG